MSNTKKQNLKIQATHKAWLSEHKQNVIIAIKEHLEQKELTYFDYIKFKTYIDLLELCNCNLTTIDFIKNKIGGLK